jgi:hypothetical protein
LKLNSQSIHLNKSQLMKKALLSLLCLLTTTIGAFATTKTVTDELDVAKLSVSTGYKEYTATTDNATYKTYAYNSSGIQLNNSSYKCGFVVTKSPGKIVKLEVTVSTYKATMTVYGSNTAYSAVSDLYSTNTAGTSIGTMEKATTYTYTVADGTLGDYQYIGIANSGKSANKISSIKITYEVETLPSAELSFATNSYNLTVGTGAYNTFTGQTLINPNSVSNITYSSDNTDLATVDETTGTVNLVADAYGTATITATFSGSESFASSKTSYTINVVDPNVATATFDFENNSYGYQRQTGNSSTYEETMTMLEEPVTITYTKGTGSGARFWSDGLRLYTGSCTISVPDEYNITNVVLTNATEGAYSLEGTKCIAGENTWTGTSKAITITNITSGKAISKVVVDYRKEKAVSIPTIHVDADNNKATIEIPEGTEVWYTTDGTTPSNSSDESNTSTKYTEGDAIAITHSMTSISAIAYDETGTASKVTTESVSYKSSIETPIITTNGNQVTITATDGLTVYYTTDGTTPSNESIEYTEPFEITADCTIKVIAYSNDDISTVQSTTVTFCKVATPTFAPTTGYVVSGNTVTIACATEGATIYYILNDGDAQEYTEGIVITTATTIKAWATATDIHYATSDTVEKQFSLAEITATTIDFTDQGWSDGAELTNVSLTKYEPYTITFAKNSASTATKYYSTGGVRLYNNTNGGSINIAVNTDASDATIQSISIDEYDTGKATATVTIAADGKSAKVQNCDSSTQLRISKITINSLGAVVENQVSSVSFDPQSNTVLETGSVITFTSNTEGATIEYNTTAADANDEAWIEGNEVTLPTAGTVTIYARAKKDGMVTSKIKSASYTVIEPLVATSIAELIEKANQYITMPVTVNMPLTVGYTRSNKKAAYVTDGTSWIQISDDSESLSYSKGDVIPAGWRAKYQLSNSYTHQLLPYTYPEAATATNALTLSEVKFSDLTTADANKVVMVNTITFSEATSSKYNTDFTGVDADNATVTFNNAFTVASVEAGTYNIEAAVYAYTNGTIKLNPISYTPCATADTEVSTETTFDFSASSSMAKNNVTLDFTGEYDAEYGAYLASGDGINDITAFTDTDETMGIKSIKITVKNPTENEDFAHQFEESNNSYLLTMINYTAQDGSVTTDYAQNVGQFAIDNDGNLNWSATDAKTVLKSFTFTPDNQVVISKIDITLDYTPATILNYAVSDQVVSFSTLKRHKVWYHKITTPSNRESQNVSPRDLGSAVDNVTRFSEVTDNTDGWSITQGNQYTCDLSQADITTGESYMIKVTNGTTTYYTAVGYNADGAVVTGLENVVENVANSTDEWYTLQGVRVANPAAGIYLHRIGNRVEKVVVK